MKVASKKPETKVMDEQTVQMEMQRKKIDKITKFRFFDFECTQDTGVHVPNLCCVQIVCEMCADEAGVDEALCKRCGDEKHMVFRGDSCKDDVCRWLFCSKSNENSVIIAHNLKGYDGFFLLQYLYDNAITPK